MENKVKTIRLTNKQAIRLVCERATAEGRSAANAAARTIIESLGSKADSNQSKQRSLDNA